MDYKYEIPILDFSRSSGVTLEGSEGWKEMSKKVIGLFESHGCFLLRCDEISNVLHEEFFTGVKSLFDLPKDTKEKFFSPRAYRGYTTKTRDIPYSETFGIDNDLNPDSAQEEFINLMWPQGNSSFGKALSSVTSKARELSMLILKMVVEGFDLPQEYKVDVEKLNSYNDARMTRYPHSQDTEGSDIGLVSHTDKGTIALICDNEVQGLQLLTKTGDWVDINIPRNGFVVIAGDILEAWSNRRLEAARHRVVTRDKERLAFVLFAVPKEGTIINGPSELVDDDNHPRRYRPFDYDEYIRYQYSTGNQKNPLEKYAGL